MTKTVDQRIKDLYGKSVLYQKKIIKIKTHRIFPSGAVSIIADPDNISLEKHLVETFFSNISLEIPEKIPGLNPKDFDDDHDINPPKKQFPEITDKQLKKNESMTTANSTSEEPTETQENGKNLPATGTLGDLVGYQPSAESIAIKNALSDMLTKVSQSDKYIPQAKAICDISNTMINMQKNEIAIVQLMSRKKG